MTTSQLDQAVPRRRLAHPRIAAGSGAAFVVLVFGGNSLTESVTTPAAEPDGEQALANFAAQAASTAARAGVVAELLGFVALAVFAAVLVDVLRRRDAFGVAGATAVISLVTMLSVKLGSGTTYLAGLAHHESLTPDVALSLTLVNGAAFVLCWLPFSVFVLTAAWALRAGGLLGRVGATLGVLFGGVGVPVALLGALDPSSAVPVPFLLGCLWTLVVSVRLTRK